MRIPQIKVMIQERHYKMPQKQYSHNFSPGVARLYWSNPKLTTQYVILESPNIFHRNYLKLCIGFKMTHRFSGSNRQEQHVPKLYNKPLLIKNSVKQETHEQKTTFLFRPDRYRELTIMS